jgi:hypothetical protein
MREAGMLHTPRMRSLKGDHVSMYIVEPRDYEPASCDQRLLLLGGILASVIEQSASKLERGLANVPNVKYSAK